MPKAITILILLAMGCSVAGNLPAAVKLPPVMGSHMVLQRDTPVPVWGHADPGETVTVTFRDQRQTAVADAQGKWLVRLRPLAVGEPAPLTIVGSNTITLTDVLVGEVWLGSGQSNMDSPVHMYAADDPVLKEAASKKYPTLRLFRSPQATAGWQEATPERLSGFSAQLFYFGMRLQQELKVPVGLLEAGVAGSPSGPFLSQAAFNSDPEIQKVAAKADAQDPLAARMKKYAAQKTGNSYEKLIRPLIPYAIRGVLWDQGEGGAVDGPIWQPMVMAALIRSWRADWGQGEFPWLYVQKPSGGGSALNPDNPMNKGAAAFVPQPKDPPATEYFSSLRQDGPDHVEPKDLSCHQLGPGLRRASGEQVGLRERATSRLRWGRSTESRSITTGPCSIVESGGQRAPAFPIRMWAVD